MAEINDRFIIEKDGPFKFKIDTEEHITYCQFKDNKNNKVYFGETQCYPEDFDVESKLIGQHIAAERALIQAMMGAVQDMKKEFKVLRQFYYTINHSKKYNPKSYEAYMLKRQLNKRETNIKLVQQAIDEKRKCLYEYIQDKDKTHKLLRKIRKDKNQDKND